MPDDNAEIKIVGTDEASPVFEKIGDSATGAASRVGDFSQSISNLNANISKLGSSIDSLSGSVSQSASGMKSAGDAANGFLSTVLGLAGISLSIGALRSLVIEMFSLADSSQRAEIAIDSLRGPAGDTTARMQELHDQAEQLGVSFQGLAYVEQRFAAFGLSVKQSRDAMHAAIEASAALNTNVEQAANSIERISVSGMLSARQLVGLGLSLDLVAKTMGQTTEAAKKTFEAMDQAGRLAVLEEALQKFDGTQEKIAGNFAGQWESASEKFKHVMQEMGIWLEGFVLKAADGFSQLVRYAEQSVQSLERLGESIGRLESGDIAGAGSAFLKAIDWSAPLDSDVKQIEKLAGSITKLGGGSQLGALISGFASGSQSVQDYIENLRNLEASLENKSRKERLAAEVSSAVANARLKGDADAARKLAELQIDAETAKQKSLLELKRIGLEEDSKLNKDHAEANFASMISINNEELKFEQDAIAKKMELQKQKAPEVRDQTLGNQSASLGYKTLAANAKLQADIAESEQRSREERIKNEAKFWEETLKLADKATEDELRLSEKKVSNDKRVAEIGARAEIDSATRAYEYQKEKIETEFDLKKITVQQKIKLLQDLERQEYATKLAAAQKELSAATPGSTDEANANAKIAQITQEFHIAMQKMADDADKSFAKPVIGAINSITGAVEGGFNRWITGHEKFAKVAEQTWHSIENVALSAIEHQLTKYITAQNLMAIAHAIFRGKEESVDAVAAGLNAGIQRAKNVSEAKSEAGVAATAAAAGVAEDSGPAAPVAAPLAAAATMASLLPFIAAAGASGGWDVPAGGPFPTLLHSREMVLPQHLADSVRNVTSSSSNSNETHNHLHVTLGAGTSPDKMEQTISHLEKAHKSGRLNFMFAR